MDKTVSWSRENIRNEGVYACSLEHETSKVVEEC